VYYDLCRDCYHSSKENLSSLEDDIMSTILGSYPFNTE
jgi:hypothetical protein